MAKTITSLEQLFTQIHKTYYRFVRYLFQECDAKALGLFRILFGFCMFLDVFQERGLEEADIRFGDPNHCFFPLFSGVKPVSVQYACVIYSFMWIGSLGILFGYKFRISCCLYLFPFLYFLLLDKSRWNNHSYLFLLTVILLSGSDATNYASLDAYFTKKDENRKCWNWNYFILKFQFTLLYFFAAVKKIDWDWLSGYSMRNISKHKILYPLSQIIGEEFLDFYGIHIGGFIFDLSVGFLLNYQKTKKLAFLSSFLFHGLNSQIFEIGMFPYVCLASLILFCSPNEFPLSWFSSSQIQEFELRNHNHEILNSKLHKKRTKSQVKFRNRCNSIQDQENTSSCPNKKQKLITNLLIGYMSVQIMLPFTHSVTKGYNNWTKGLYGYSWDMMCHSWDTLHTKITVKDNITKKERYLDPDVWTTNDRWSSHADMAKQYAECIERNLLNFNITNIEVYFDVWKSLNGRFQQRIFDPRVNILKAPWSPWEEVVWVLPLLQEFSHWRRNIFTKISKEVGTWTKSSNVIFVADYPGLTLENYLPDQLSNVSLILMKGEIIVEQKSMKNVTLKNFHKKDFDLNTQKNRVSILTDAFHKIHTISSIPSSYMYTYTNHTEDAEPNETKNETQKPTCVQIVEYFKTILEEKTSAFKRSFFLVVNSYLNILFDVPMVIRKNIDRI